MSRDQVVYAPETSSCGQKNFRFFMTPEQRVKRVHRKPLAVLMTPGERAKIESNAAAKGLSVSAYLRTLGLGYEPRPVLDAEYVDGLLKLGSDLGRLSELLKSWLNEPPGRGAPEIDVRQLVTQLVEAREQIADKVTEMQP